MQEYENTFSSLEIDAIGEILNISLGSSATAISNLLEKRVDITTPTVKIVSFDEFEFSDLEPAIGVEIEYIEGLEGTNVMLLKRGDIRMIVELLMSTEIPEEEFEINEMSLSAICEVMNQMMGASSTALSEFLGESVNISTPVSFQVTDNTEFKQKYFTVDEPMITVRFLLKIESVLESEFLNLMPVKLAKRLVAGFGLPTIEDELSMAAEEARVIETVPEAPAIAEVPAAVQTVTPEPSPPPPPPPVYEAPAPAPPPAVQPTVTAPPPPPVYTTQAPPRVISVQQAPNVIAENIDIGRLSKEHPANLDLIMSIPLQISVEIGRTKKPLKEILEFTPGTLVVLDRLAGEHVDLFVNGQCVAKGDVVVVDDSFGIRITDIVKPIELSGK